MIKHICICDKCGKEDNLKLSYIDGKPIYVDLPNSWEEHGIMPKYQLCNKCSSELKCEIEKFIYDFVNRGNENEH